MLEGLRLRSIAFHGAGKEPAALSFGPGLNVIYGASDTGKSFVVEAIDFMLGGKAPLRDIPEGIGYDRITLGLEALSGEAFTLLRSVQGGAFRLYEGLYAIPPDAGVPARVLADQHSEKNTENLSAFLLGRCGLAGKRVRRNQAGDTNSLSFRHLARLVIVDENEIIAKHSPLSDGNPTADTANFATFKLLLTGTDDSALTTKDPRAADSEASEAQVGLLDQLLGDYRRRLRELTDDPDNLRDQLERIESSLSQHGSQLGATESTYRQLVDRRRELRKKLEDGRDRRSEVGSLIERFELLDRHYASDLARLHGIEEGGNLFGILGQGPCPLCGAEPEHHRLHEECDANVEVVVAAARSEITKIELLRRELGETLAGLRREAKGFDRRLPVVEEQLRVVAGEAEQVSSPLSRLRTTYAGFADKRGELREALSLLDTIRDIERRRGLLEHGTDENGAAAITDGDLPASVATQFALGIEQVLTAWHFPQAERVYFDPKTRDIVIGGKHRAARGKGLRAITHAAFTLGILDISRGRGNQHPGFVVLDSPLLAYREPEGDDFDLSGTDLKEQFFGYLVSLPEDRQVVIVENTDPPPDIAARHQVQFFSANPNVGRYGFFPAPSLAKGHKSDLTQP